MRFLAILPLLLPVSLAGPLDPAPAAGVETPAAARRTDLVTGLQVLHEWDARRERAWAGTDPAALRALYTPGSQAGRADRRLLRAYAARGLVVRRIVTQVFAVRVIHRDATSMRLRVFDRVAGGEVVEDGRARGLPSSSPVTRDIELRLGGDTWRVASVSGSVRDPRAAPR